MRIVIDKPMYVNREAVCKHLGEGSKFLGSWCMKTNTGNWSEQPVDVFYNPNPPAPFTNKLVGFYIRVGLGSSDEGLYICDATSALEINHMACIVEEDIVYVSKYRHDFVKTPTGGFIDGGRDYVRTTSVRIDHELFFDYSLGNFYLISRDAHGSRFVNIEYRE